METPTRADYIQIYFTLFAQFEQAEPVPTGRGRRFTYQQQVMIVVFTCMLIRRITEFNAQRRWLATHPEEASGFGFRTLPHRTTLSRRYKRLAGVVQAFSVFVGQWTEPVDAACSGAVLVVDGSLFKARGPIWHQADRAQQRVPEKLRNLDQDASWGKSGYHGWVYGYRLHLICTLAGFPKRVQITTGSSAESAVLDQQADALMTAAPTAVIGDNSVCKAMRIRTWARRGGCW